MPVHGHSPLVLMGVGLIREGAFITEIALFIQVQRLSVSGTACSQEYILMALCSFSLIVGNYCLKEYAHRLFPSVFM